MNTFISSVTTGAIPHLKIFSVSLIRTITIEDERLGPFCDERAALSSIYLRRLPFGGKIQFVCCRRRELVHRTTFALFSVPPFLRKFTVHVREYSKSKTDHSH